MVTPGFDLADHNFLRRDDTMEDLLTPEQVQQLRWLLKSPG